jgi:hypothetical protein
VDCDTTRASLQIFPVNIDLICLCFLVLIEKVCTLHAQMSISCANYGESSLIIFSNPCSSPMLLVFSLSLVKGVFI